MLRQRVIRVCTCIWVGLVVMLSPATQAASSGEWEYAKGLAALSHCNYARAHEHFRNAAELEPHDAEVKFHLGLSLRYLGEFEAAIAVLHEALALMSSPRNPDASTTHSSAYLIPQMHYHLGWSYLQLERDSEAQYHFQQAETFDPKFSRQLTDYHQGIAFYKLGCTRQAEETLKAAVRGRPASREAQIAQRYLNDLRRREREERWFKVQATLGLQYDDNVIVEPNDVEFAFGRQADGSTVFTLNGQLQYVELSPWRFGAEYTLFQSLHFSLDEFDLQSHTGGLFLDLELHRSTLRGEASYTYTLLGNERFFEAVTLQPSLSIQWTNRWYTVLSFRYRTADFFNQIISTGQEDVRDRDGWTARAGFDQYLILNRNGSSLRLSYQYESSRNDGTDWEYDSHYVALGLRWVGRWDIILDLNGEYTRRTFLHPNSFDAPPLAVRTLADSRERFDDRISWSIALVRPIGSYFSLSAGYVHISNLSNLDFFDYRRNIMTLSITGRY